MTDDSTPLDYDPSRTVYATDPDADGDTETDRSHWPDHTDPEWLHWHYWVLKRAQSEMAEIADVTGRTVSYWMNKHDIPTRDKSKAVSLVQGVDKRLRDDEWLREQYHDNERSTLDIAEQLGCDDSSIRRALRRRGIKTRSLSEAQKTRQEREASDRKYNDETWLRHQYHTQGKSTRQIAQENEWGKTTVERALHRHGIQTRSKKAANLLRNKQEKCPTDTTDRDLVTSDGIDASWQDSSAGTDGCYLDYRDPAWLREQVRAGRSGSDIVDRSECDVGLSTVHRWLNRFDIEPAGAEDG